MPSTNIAAIKSAIKSILDAANNVAGSPIDLSSGLGTRVQQVLKVNPDNIYVDPGSFPFVSIFTANKSIEIETIGHKGSQTSALRRADLELTIAGAVQQPLIDSVKEDASDENVERLMENVEEILRANVNLNNTVNWSYPTNVSYHTAPWDEQTIIRGAIMTFLCKVWY